MDYSPPGSSVHGDSPGKNTEVSCHDLPDPEIEPTSPVAPALLGGFFTTVPPRKPKSIYGFVKYLLYLVSRSSLIFLLFLYDLFIFPMLFFPAFWKFVCLLCKYRVCFALSINLEFFFPLIVDLDPFTFFIWLDVFCTNSFILFCNYLVYNAVFTIFPLPCNIILCYI